MKLKILNPLIGTKYPLPGYQTEGSAGIDLRAMIDEPFKLWTEDARLVPTGIAIHIADPNIAAIIIPRSGLGHRSGLVIGNLVGLIDSDYQGELMVSAWNRSETPILIEPGDRIAQLVFVPVIRPTFEVVTEFEPTARGAGGFGSTGA